MFKSLINTLSTIKNKFNLDAFIANILAPLFALFLYCLSFAGISYFLFLEGVNYFFSSRFAYYLMFMVIGLILILIILLKIKKLTIHTFFLSKERPRPDDLLLVFLPLTPVAQYVINNQEILSLTESLYLLVFFLFFSILYMFFVPVLVGGFFSTRTMMLAGLVFVFMITNMPYLSDYFFWFERGQLKIQVLIYSAIFWVVWLLYKFNGRLLHLFIVVNFLLNSLFQMASQYEKMNSVSASQFEENPLLMLSAGKTPNHTPSIYLLVYDAYVPNETMLSYGIDNKYQEEYLRDQGFVIYPYTYSIGSTTLETMSTVLNSSTGFYGDQRRSVSGDGVTQNILKGLDYETYGLFYSDYMFRGYGQNYDVSLPEYVVLPYTLLLNSILMGEFRFNVEDVGFIGQTRQQFVDAKMDILGGLSDGRVFVYMHSNLPAHSQNSGSCLPDEIALFDQRLKQANVEMRQDVGLIVENDPDAIVIVAGDHGPYLTKNCTETNGDYDISEITRLDIQDRHATFLAIRWPANGGYESYDDITILQDVFPVVFAYLFDDPIFLKSMVEPVIPLNNHISGASVNDGLIIGGVDDGEPLFLTGR